MIISQYVQVSNYDAVHSKLMCYVSITYQSINKLKRKRNTKLSRERGTHGWLGTVPNGFHGTVPCLGLVAAGWRPHHQPRSDEGTAMIVPGREMGKLASALGVLGPSHPQFLS